MRSNGVHIAAVGARTPLGLTAESSAAAVRAGIDRLSDHPFMIDRLGNPMRAVMDRLLDPDLIGPERLVELIATALRDVGRKLLPLRGMIPDMPLLLGLPEIRPGWTEDSTRWVAQGIANLDLPFPLAGIETFSRGHAAGLMAMEVAYSRIHSGQSELCLVGGVDSYFDADTMEWLDENKQLAGADTRSAFIPGEGAGCCLLASHQLLQRARLTSLAEIRSAHTAHEPHRIKTDTICLGQGLTAVVREAVKPLALPQEKIEGVICDINGERYRCEEWGFALLRTSPAFVDPTAYDLPASHWGDVGAASGPLFATLAIAAGQRGYAKGKHYLIWASSEGGERSAALLELNLQEQGARL